MTNTQPQRVLVANATTQFGRLVIDSLLKRAPTVQIVASVRNPKSKAAKSLLDLGVEVRFGDYAQPDSLAAAFNGIERLLLIPSHEIGQRVSQHCNVFGAAKKVGVRLVAYTSVLHADTSPLEGAEEHCHTELALRVSRAPYVVLRNGWCTEEIAAFVLAALANDLLFPFYCSAGGVNIASATRADYADAAAAILTSEEDQNGRVYELAGDESYTLPKFVTELSRQSGKPFSCWSLPEAELRAQLIQSGFSERFSALIANFNPGAELNGLSDDSRQLSALIGRPTTPLAITIAQMLNNLKHRRREGLTRCTAAGRTLNPHPLTPKLSPSRFDARRDLRAAWLTIPRNWRAGRLLGRTRHHHATISQ
jgi:NAD(P)H dehydrogenase (quinone)